MNGFRILKILVLGFYFLLPTSTLHAELTPTPVQTETPGAFYHFESNTAWAGLKILVHAYPDHFQMEVESTSPISGWFVKDRKTGKILSRGSMAPSLKFETEIPLEFQMGDRLTLFTEVNREDTPISVELGPSAESSSPDSPSPDDFEINPDHPYNRMVKNLYEEAIQDYSNGDKPSACRLLRQAEDLDPDQPQVESFLKKLDKESSDHSINEAVSQALKKWKEGDPYQALAELEDYLAQYPQDSAALDLKKQIEDSQQDRKNRKNKKSKEATVQDKKMTPTPSPNASIAPTGSLAQVSEADQAYNLGLDAYRKDDFADAEKFWEQTLQIQPNHLQARRNLDRLKAEHPELK